MEDVLAPKQQRSRETLSRLLRGAIEVMEQYGLAGATIPRIAQAAGVAPASVYRRFRDRDALLRAAFLSVLEQSAASTRTALRIESFPDKTLAGVVRALLHASIQQYVRHPGLMRAFIRFAETDSDPHFRGHAAKLVSGNFGAMADLLLAHFREEIGHSDPERAILFAMASAATVIEERAIEEVSLWHTLLPMPDSELLDNLTRQVLAYLR